MGLILFGLFWGFEENAELRRDVDELFRRVRKLERDFYIDSRVSESLKRQRRG